MRSPPRHVELLAQAFVLCPSDTTAERELTQRLAESFVRACMVAGVESVLAVKHAASTLLAEERNRSVGGGE